MKEDLLWKCHICKLKFAIELGKGVICANCNKPTCNRHLALTNKVEGKTVYVCSVCFSKSTDM